MKPAHSSLILLLLDKDYVKYRSLSTIIIHVFVDFLYSGDLIYSLLWRTLKTSSNARLEMLRTKLLVFVVQGTSDFSEICHLIPSSFFEVRDRVE